MTALCPSCAAQIDGEAGEDVICPACMTAFTLGDELPARAPQHWDVQLPDGTLWEKLGRYAVREMVYTLRVPISARVRPYGMEVPWQPVHAYPEFAAIYTALHVEVPLAQGTRKIAGWKGVDRPRRPAAATPRAPRPAPPRPVAVPADLPVAETAPLPAPTAPPGARGAPALPVLLLLGVVASALVALLLVFALT